MEDKARNIVTRLAESLDTVYHGFSSMTPTVYDTAWLSMVTKKEIRDEVKITYWLFPECFQAVLEDQSPNGGFCPNGAHVDGILSTMAAVLTLYRHQKDLHILDCSQSSSDLQERISKACAYLDQALKVWDVKSTVQVGFEILVPSLLWLLEREGISFNFPGRKALMALHRQKVNKVKPAVLYTHHKTTLLHSLESFIGSLDFDKMSHSLSYGSMMGSPSSTAAYLMNSSDWDEEAEKYLRFVVATTKGRVPSAFPISVFEVSWVLSTLLRSGFTVDSLGTENISKMANYLEAQLEEGNGVTGFAPGMLADADDTAKSIFSLELLDRATNCDAMLKAFESSSHFKTYNLETNESFSANCNVTIALLGSKDPSRYIPQISKAMEFLCNAWENGQWSDKWIRCYKPVTTLTEMQNIEPQYAMMVFAEALSSAIEHWNNGSLQGLDPKLLGDHVPLITLQIAVRTLSSQSDSGAWKESAEITAYGLLTLKALSNLPWVRIGVGLKVNESIDLGSNYLHANSDSWTTPAMIWVEKVNFGSAVLSETYCLAALKAIPSNSSWSEAVLELCNIPSKRLDHFCLFFQHLPIFKEEPTWRLRASVVEGYLLAPTLQRATLELDIFPRVEGKYLEYIPFTWTTCNNAASFGLSTQTIIEMMVISLLNFQADKWFEDTTEDTRLQGDLQALKATIRQLFNENMGERKRPMQSTCHQKHHQLSNDKATNGHDSANTQINGNGTFDLAADSDGKTSLLVEAKSTLSNFVRYVLGKVSAASTPDHLRRRVRHELYIFLLAHVTQGEDNVRLAKSDMEQQTSYAFASTGTYYDWVRTTSADHTSCPYSFEFFRCLVSSSACKGVDCFSGARAQYLAQDVCRHLATMCRQHNDYGSIVRDRKEKNLNSINFPEFHLLETEGEAHEDHKAKQALLEIAIYERECLQLAGKRLSSEVTKSTWKAWKVFIDVTDLYGQIYVVRDINSGGRE
ncbi:hypothetical protein N7507_004334 [Penicillium longicatenatum]|nr:hypothetical protein N7507_004334 [Penicillium longicatenatum]